MGCGSWYRNGLRSWAGTSWDIWALRLLTFWVVWAVTYLGLTWFLISRSSAQQTQRWALDQRTPPRPRISILRSVILRILRVVFLVSRTSSLFFIVLVSLVSLVLASAWRPMYVTWKLNEA
jgi:hypothetical protein